MTTREEINFSVVLVLPNLPQKMPSSPSLEDHPMQKQGGNHPRERPTC